MGTILTRATTRGALAQVRYITPVRPRDAAGLVATVYRQMRHDFGMLAPPVLLHSPAPTTMAAAWLMLRESLLARTRTPRPVKEAVAAAVSMANTCPYCVEVHTTTLRGLTRPRYAVASHTGRIDAVADPTLHAAVEWAQAGARRAGTARHSGYRPADDVIAVATTFHYLNRMVSIFLHDSPLPPGIPSVARPGVRNIMGRLMAPAARTSLPPGAAVDLLPAPRREDDSGSPYTADVGGRPVLTDTFERARAAIDAAGERSVPATVRNLVMNLLIDWDGHLAWSHDAWLAQALAGLTPADRAVGRLVLCAAFAPTEVGHSIDEFRAGNPTDSTLVEATSWASMAAAWRINQWIRAGGDDTNEKSQPRLAVRPRRHDSIPPSTL